MVSSGALSCRKTFEATNDTGGHVPGPSSLHFCCSIPVATAAESAPFSLAARPPSEAADKNGGHVTGPVFPSGELLLWSYSFIVTAAVVVAAETEFFVSPSLPNLVLPPPQVSAGVDDSMSSAHRVKPVNEPEGGRESVAPPPSAVIAEAPLPSPGGGKESPPSAS